MRLLILLLLASGFGFSACKKYNLKQPSHISFDWKVVNASADAGSVEDIYFYASGIEIKGTREEGEDISLSQTIPSGMISVSPQTFFAVKVDIPMGDYKSLDARISFANEEGSNFGVNGKAVVMGTPVAFKVIWKDLDEIVFRSAQLLEFKKKKDYNLSMCLDVNKLMAGITQEDWNTASVSQDPGGPAVLIQDVKNHNLFMKIQDNLPDAVYIIPG